MKQLDKMSKFAYLTLIFTLTTHCSTQSAFADTTQAQSSRIAPWETVNTDFRRLYMRSLGEKRKKFGPVILCSGGDMTLFKNGTRFVVNLIPEKYSFFKTVAHVPLTIFVALDNHCDEALGEPLLKDLSEFKKKYNIAGESFKNWQLDKITLDRQQSMLDDCNSFLDRVMAEKKVSQERLDNFARSMRDRVLKNADDAVFYELAKTDNQIAQWKKTMSQDEWDKLKVIVVSPHMPRQQNRQMIYFQSLLKEKEEGQRLIYMDGDPDQEEKALNLLATHDLDRDIAISFFNDPWRMHRDLLGDAGRKFIRQHKPGSGGISIDN